MRTGIMCVCACLQDAHACALPCRAPPRVHRKLTTLVHIVMYSTWEVGPTTDSLRVRAHGGFVKGGVRA